MDRHGPPSGRQCRMAAPDNDAAPGMWFRCPTVTSSPGSRASSPSSPRSPNPTRRAARCATAASTSTTSSAGCPSARSGACSSTTSSTRACRRPSRSRCRCTPATSGSTCSRALATLAPLWGFRPLLDIDDEEARDNLARASVMALSFVGQSARGQGQPMIPQREVDKGRTIVERFMIRWRGEPDPRHVEADRRLLGLRGRARHERLDLHRPGDRLHRRRRRRLPVRRGRRDVAARCTAAPPRACCT